MNQCQPVMIEMQTSLPLALGFCLTDSASKAIHFGDAIAVAFDVTTCHTINKLGYLDNVLETAESS